jgi:hypothetical protein
MIDAWWIMFQDMEYHEFQRGILFAVREHEYAGFPPVAKIMKHSSKKMQDVGSQAAEAWAHVRATIKKYGSYYSVSFSDPLIHSVIVSTFGSWVKLCENTSDDLTRYRQIEFCRAYTQLASAQQLPHMQGHLPGINEIESGRTKHGAIVDTVAIESAINNSRISPRETQMKITRNATDTKQIGDILKLITPPQSEAG